MSEKLAMATKEEVQSFLLEFHQKMKIWEIRCKDDREKNTQALLSLDINSIQRKKVIEELSVADYSEGPLPDSLNASAPLWVFGKTVKGIMVYIKISIGKPNSQVKCISFHEAEHEIKLPFNRR
ncbi:MAG TPA: hypothetical protein VNS58_12085 [Puia sp.]|nr:hypothetical protein [Puia sp.]